MKSKILKECIRLNFIDKYYKLRDFIIVEGDNYVIFSYNHGDMGLIDKIIYDKKEHIISVYDLNNYYGDTYLIGQSRF